MKPSLFYAILIAVMVIAVTLYGRSNSPDPRNLGTPVKSLSNEPIVQETPASKQEAETRTDNGDKAVEPTDK